MRKSVLSAIRQHAVEEYPKEACGLVLLKDGKEAYRRCRNISEDPEESFVMCPKDLMGAEEEGDVVMLVHSHPNSSAKPSEIDLVVCEEENLPTLIVSTYKDLITGDVVAGDFTVTEPSGYVAPLIGRRWGPPKLDCLSLVRDYYRRELDIAIDDYELEMRSGKWWEDASNSSLYLKHYEAAGFVRVDDGPKLHDLIIMEVGSKAGPNHAGIYVGEGMMLHHLYGRLSGRVNYGGYWLETTSLVVRHKEML